MGFITCQFCGDTYADFDVAHVCNKSIRVRSSNMNMRIKELAIQAGYNPLPGFAFANSLEEVFLSKFAQLIVQECAKISRDYAGGSVPLMISQAIKQHFGVKND